MYLVRPQFAPRNSPLSALGKGSATKRGLSASDGQRQAARRPEAAVASETSDPTHRYPRYPGYAE